MGAVPSKQPGFLDFLRSVNFLIGPWTNPRLPGIPRGTNMAHTEYSGSCYCAQARIFFHGPILRQGLCHCTECKKYTGSAYSINVVVSDQDWQTTGRFKSITKTADSGNGITTHFCPDCGSSMYRDGPTFAKQKVVQAGVLDGETVLSELEMEVELYAPQRVKWVKSLDSTEDRAGMR